MTSGDSDSTELKGPWDGPSGPRRQRIYNRLAGLGEVRVWWEDACRFLMNPSAFRATTHWIGHALRELESGLTNLLVALAPDPAASDEESSVREPGALEKSGRKSKISRVGGVLGMDSDSEALRRWKRINPDRLAHRDGLGIRPLSEDFSRAFDEFTDVLEVVSQRWEHRFTGWLELIDELKAAKSPTRADALRLMQHVPHNHVTLARFFEGLGNPRWIDLAQARPLFHHPPEVEYDEAAGLVHYASWPQGAYLARVAEERPDPVTDLVEQWPVGENPAVLSDLARIALALTRASPPHAVRVSAMVSQWVAVLPGWVRTEHLREVCELVGDLAAVERVEDAVELAAELLAVFPDPETDQRQRFRTRRQPVGRIAGHEYAAIAGSLTYQLGYRAAPRVALELFAGLLEQAAALSPPLADDGVSPDVRAYTSDDASTNWRQVIEGDQEHSDDIRDALVEAVRDLAERVVARDSGAALEVIDLLLTHRWAIFKRLVLHLLRRSGDPKLIGQWLCDRDRLEDQALVREYVTLAEDRFADLPAQQREQIVDWIGSGPRNQADLARYEGQSLEEAVRRWRLQRLHPIGEQLPQPWRDVYRTWAAAGPWPDPRGIARFYSRTIEPGSPVDKASLRSMSVAEIADLCGSYRSPDDRRGEEPSEEGLARSVRAAVEANPARFASDAARFRDLQPVYVRALFDGLHSALIRHPHPPNSWSAVWQMVLTVASGDVAEVQPDADPWSRRGDRTWIPARRAAADLLATAFGYPHEKPPRDTGEFVDELLPDERSDVIAALHALAADDDPDPRLAAHLLESSRQYGVYDTVVPMLTGTIRAGAIEAAVNLAWWLRRQGLLDPDAGLGGAPDVQAVLDGRLEPGKEAAPAVHGMFGLRFRHLAELDPAWAAERSAAVFGPSADGVDDRQALAWKAYLDHHDRGVAGWLWDVLHERYAFAVELLGQGRASGDDRVDGSVAWHVATLYRDGVLPLRGGLIERFFTVASATLRAAALGSANPASPWGTDSAELLSAEVLERLQALWDWRLSVVAERGSPGEDYLELTVFASWFSSGVFDAPWALGQLLAALRLAGQWAGLPEREGSVVVWRLGDLAADPLHTGDVIACVTALLLGSWDDEAVYEVRQSLARVVWHGRAHAPLETDLIENILAHRVGPDFPELVAAAGAELS